jgi:hypothetical protein
MHVIVHTRRARATALAATAALVFSTSTVALAEDTGADPAVEEDTTEEETTETIFGLVECGAELLDDEDAYYPLYLVEPGEEVDCTASGLDPEALAGWHVTFFGLTDDLDLDPEGDLDEAGEELHERATDLEVAADGTLTFSFAVPQELVLGDFDGYVWQGDEEDPSYLAEFGGFVFGDLFGELVCEPDPAVQGGEVECTAEELTEGDFDWEVYYLSMSELLDIFTGVGDDDLAPDDDGTGDAGADGIGTYAFTIPAEGDHDVYLTFVEQDDYLAFAIGEIEPAPTAPTPAPTPTPGVEQPAAPAPGPGAAPVTVKQPARVDAGAGGASPGGATTSLVAVGLLAAVGLALTAGVRRGLRSRR